ncbi:MULTISPECIES: hypothetical protein [Pasteurella]|uniref:hypothetical protein n=1 Tax=Pasteurella TaxID=745 RepID=UPI00292F482A|nr:hypothetical protein [Pasteurella multocida]HEH9616931.1 hypothetical protein [Pasteurella multocida]HEH9663182.1 hypothetical protein [Pasteurella multocida]HEH9676820.1 hypothetical protein [Pasteurella multocida]HEH9690164.1 hypothetical protein [Pasteurella multocida]HEH9699368.1 hypothetical protein [Pasteurella multocida]
MSISNEKWSEIARKLSELWNVSFLYKGRLIEVNWKIHKNKIIWFVFIDGAVNFFWSSKESEMFYLVEKFWFKRSRSLYTQKQRKEYKGLISKKSLEKKIGYFQPYFTSVSTLVRQFKKIEGLTIKED